MFSYISILNNSREPYSCINYLTDGESVVLQAINRFCQHGITGQIAAHSQDDARAIMRDCVLLLTGFLSPSLVLVLASESD